MSRTILIAGVGPGFCEELAWTFAREGHPVGLFSRSEEYLDDFERELVEAGHEALAVPVDVTDPSQVAEGFARIREQLGPVGVLAHAASVPTTGAEGVDPDQLETMWRLHTYAGLVCFREALMDMREDGGTVFFFGASEDAGDYAFQSAKHAAYGMARSLAEEYGPRGIHVAHVTIAGRLDNPDIYEKWDDIDEEEYIDGEAAAETCYHLATQPERAQTFDVELHAGARTKFD